MWSYCICNLPRIGSITCKKILNRSSNFTYSYRYFVENLKINVILILMQQNEIFIYMKNKTHLRDKVAQKYVFFFLETLNKINIAFCNIKTTKQYLKFALHLFLFYVTFNKIECSFV